MWLDLVRLQSDIAQIQHDSAGFGTGRLVAENLVLTAAHTLNRDDGTGPVLEGWQVRLARDQGETIWPFRRGNRVVWHDQTYDIALIQLVNPEGGPLRPKLRLRVAAVLKNNAHAVEARGYPRASKRTDGPRELTLALGRLTATDQNRPLRFGVDHCDLPNTPHQDWPGMSGSAVLLQNWLDEDTIWVYGVVRDVPGNFNGQLSVARLADAWKNVTFRSLLVAAGAPDKDTEDPTDAKPRIDILPPPLLPGYLVPRPDDLLRLKQALLSDSPSRDNRMIALQGMGGVGKTYLANAVCSDRTVIDAFPEGIVWLTFGPREAIGLSRVQDVAKFFGDSPDFYTSLDMAGHRLPLLLRDRAMLIVLDDIWYASHLQPFLIKGARCRVLLTTRSGTIAQSVGAEVVPLRPLKPAQSLDLLRAISGRDEPSYEIIASRLGHLPLALRLVGGSLRAGTSGSDWLTAFDNKLSSINTGGSIPSDREQNLAVCLELSLEGLPIGEQRLFASFGIFPAGGSVPVDVINRLWTATLEGDGTDHGVPGGPDRSPGSWRNSKFGRLFSFLNNG